MLSAETHPLAENLHATTCRLTMLLDNLLAGSDSAEGGPAPASAEMMAGLLTELMQAGHWLRSLPATADATLNGEVAAYRKQVERLQAVLPSMHAALLQERSRLEQERERLRRSAEWAHGARQTL